MLNRYRYKKNIIKVALGLLLCFTSHAATAQLWEPDELAATPYGLHFGIGLSRMNNKELQNSRLGTSFNAGFYLYGQKKKREKNNYQAELNFKFSKYKFANAKLGNSAYTKISIISIDVPLMWRKRIGVYTEQSHNHFLLGIQPSMNLKSALYIGSEEEPAQSNNYNNTWSNLPLQPYNLSIVTGIRSTGKSAGIQLMFKAGIVDLNRNFNLPQYLPATGTGRSIRTATVELDVVF